MGSDKCCVCKQGIVAGVKNGMDGRNRVVIFIMHTKDQHSNCFSINILFNSI